MKIKNLARVNELNEEITSCMNAMSELDAWVHDKNEDYWCYLSGHSDGSGRIADLTGCRVATDVVAATRGVLAKKIARNCEELASLGVDVSIDELDAQYSAEHA